MSARRIESPRNPLIRELVRLRERRQRERVGQFLIEGAREVGRAAQAGIKFEHALYCPAYATTSAQNVLREVAGHENVTWTELGAPAFERLSQRGSPDGIAVVARLGRPRLEQLHLPPTALVLVLDGLEKPGNLGSLMRVADAAGVDAVLTSDESVDIANPNAIRSSMGSVFALPVVGARSVRLREYLQAAGIARVVASPAASCDYWRADLRGSCAIVLGAEHAGVSKEWFVPPCTEVSVPMRGLADSLNVSVTGALLVYEALRQRR